MLLFSIKVPVKGKLTRDEFVRLVIRWNQGSPYDRIKNLNWDGVSKNVEFSENKKTLAFEELCEKNIVAARFRKEDENGIIWTSDFVLNAMEKKLSVKLEREATEDTTIFIPRFNVPYLIKMVIREKLLDTDKGIEISNTVKEIDKTNYKIIEEVILRKQRYLLPIVYVTKTWAGNYPLNILKLSERLQGVAHVFAEADSIVSKVLKEECGGENVHHGGIGIYYPSISARNKRINPTRYEGNEEYLLDKIVRNVYVYSNQQKQEKMYTWEGIQNELLSIRYAGLDIKRREAENENKELYDIFDEQLAKQAKTIEALNKRVAALEQENTGLHNQINGMSEEPLLYYGEEDELYDGEIREIILDILSDYLKQQRRQSRRRHIINDILESNEFSNEPENRKKKIKSIFKGYSNLSGTMRQGLQKLGFRISGDGKHYKLTYYGDARYVATMAKSSSDHRAGDNLAMEIINNML